MRILVLSDLHGMVPKIGSVIKNEKPEIIVLSGDIVQTLDFPSLVYSYVIKGGSRKEYIHYLKTKFLDRYTQLQILSAKSIIRQLTVHEIPILAIPGNVETPGVREWMKIQSDINPYFIWLQEKSLVIDDIQFFGFGFVTDSSNSKRARSFGEIAPLPAYKKLNKLSRQVIDDMGSKILISHSPPYLTKLDYVPTKKIHVGSKPIRYFIENAEIDVVICGHIHESRGIHREKKWWGINSGAAIEGSISLIDTSKTTVKWIRDFRSKFSLTSLIYKVRSKLRYDEPFKNKLNYRLLKDPSRIPSTKNSG